RVWRELQREIRLILDAELVHGDLSAFNVLWWHERPVIIDFSQAVDAVVHPAARDLLRRDVERTAGYFRRQGVAVDLDAALALVGDSPARFAHQVLSSLAGVRANDALLGQHPPHRRRLRGGARAPPRCGHPRARACEL